MLVRMPQRSSQQGVGMVEVLIALLLLSIAVLGFVALQFRAVDASSEAASRIQAVNLAQDLTERIRANPSQLAKYREKINASTQVYTLAAQTACNGSSGVTSSAMAECDSAQVIGRAKYLNVKIAMPDCSGMTYRRSCIYVAWKDTNAVNGSGENDCTSDGIYKPNASCIVLESY